MPIIGPGSRSERPADSRKVRRYAPASDRGSVLSAMIFMTILLSPAMCHHTIGLQQRQQDAAMSPAYMSDIIGKMAVDQIYLHVLPLHETFAGNCGERRQSP